MDPRELSSSEKASWDNLVSSLRSAAEADGLDPAEVVKAGTEELWPLFWKKVTRGGTTRPGVEGTWNPPNRFGGPAPNTMEAVDAATAEARKTPAKPIPNFGPSVQRGNPPWKERLSSFYNELLPMLGAGVSDLAGISVVPPTGGGSALALPALNALGWATGKETGRQLDDVLGVRRPPPATEQYGSPLYQKGQQVKRDLTEGAGAALTGLALGRVAGKAFQEPEPIYWRDKTKLKALKAINPTKGKLQEPNFENKIVEGIENIIKRRDQIKLFDKDGREVAGLIPDAKKTGLDDTLSASAQGMKLAFDEYNSLMTKSGERGAKFSTKPLRDFLQNELESKARKLGGAGSLDGFLKENIAWLDENPVVDLKTAQDALTYINNQVGATTDPAFASRVHVLAQEAKLIRKQLDETIEESGGAGYQELRNEYGSYRELHDAVKQAIIQRNRKQLTQSDIDLIDIWTSSLAVSGAIAGNPASIGRATIIELVRKLSTIQKNPDRNMALAFRNADKGIKHNLKLAEEEAMRREVVPGGTKKIQPLGLPKGTGQVNRPSENRLALPNPGGTASEVDTQMYPENFVGQLDPKKLALGENLVRGERTINYRSPQAAGTEAVTMVPTHRPTGYYPQDIGTQIAPPKHLFNLAERIQKMPQVVHLDLIPSSVYKGVSEDVARGAFEKVIAKDLTSITKREREFLYRFATWAERQKTNRRLSRTRK